MARSGVPSAFSDAQLTAFFAVEFAFDSGTTRLWNGIGDLTIGSDTYTGSASVMSISGIEEDADISAKGVNVTLSGITSTVLGYALNENYQGRSLKIHVGTIADDGTVASYTVFSGLMDVMSITEDGETCTINISAESRLIDLERARVRRYTSEDQKQLHPSDSGFDFVASIQEQQIEWG